MARIPRSLTVSDEGGFYHVTNRVCGSPRYYPFRRSGASRMFLQLLFCYLDLYFCRCAALEIMGNHYHLVLSFEPPRALSRPELQERAKIRFGQEWEVETAGWEDQDWEYFNERLFDISCFMQDLQGQYTTWFNKKFDRRGAFWGGRFKASLLTDLDAVQEIIFYNELNACRAGLVKRPEDWKMGSAYLRMMGKDEKLIPLEELFPEEPREQVFECYRARLLYKGLEEGREGQAKIPEHIVRAEEARGFTRPGMYLKRMRHWTDGLVIGTAERIRHHLSRLIEQGVYRGNRHPISQMDGLFFTLREQRSHARS